MAGEYGDPDYYYGEIGTFVAWDGLRIVRTLDIMAASPTWARIDTGIDGDMVDVRYTIRGEAVIGWCLTKTALFLCEDLRATSPTWAEILAIETVRASDATPSGTGQDVEFHGMAVSSSAPEFCILTTGPSGNETQATDYPHAYYWITDDLGQTWAQSDMNGYLESSGLLDPPLGVRGYHLADVYSLDVVPSTTPGEVGTIYCVRGTPAVGAQAHRRVFISADVGATWSMAASSGLTFGINNRLAMALRAPDPVSGRPSYLSAGPVGVSDRPDLHRSSDDWASLTTLTSNGDPTGYGGLVQGNGSSLEPVANRYGDPDHVVAWFRNSTSPNASQLLESVNQGDDFALLWANGTGASFCPVINWPPDALVWVAVRRTQGDLATITNAVLLTVDNWATVVDKSGNLDSLLPNWDGGSGGGFALPKTLLPPAYLSATLTTLLRVQAGRQEAFDSPAAMAVGLPVVGDYQDAPEEHVAPWDWGAWTPTVIVDRVANYATFTLKGVGFFETLPMLFEAGFGAMLPDGDGPYAYAGGAVPGEVGEPVPYTFRFGGDNAGLSSMIQIQDAYCSMLRLKVDQAAKVVFVEADFFGRYYDDNEGAGYVPAAVQLPPNLGMMAGLRGTLGLQDAGASGGAFDDLDLFQCSLISWSLDFDTGLRPKWAGDNNALTYCGVRHVAPIARFQPVIRTTSSNYAVILTKAQQRTYQELALDLAVEDGRGFGLRLTGRWLSKLNAHERERGEVVMRPTFIAETPPTQTTTPHWATWAIDTLWGGL